PFHEEARSDLRHRRRLAEEVEDAGQDAPIAALPDHDSAQLRVGLPGVADFDRHHGYVARLDCAELEALSIEFLAGGRSQRQSDIDQIAGGEVEVNGV